MEKELCCQTICKIIAAAETVNSTRPTGSIEWRWMKRSNNNTVKQILLTLYLLDVTVIYIIE